jgi:hypothetical protein
MWEEIVSDISGGTKVKYERLLEIATFTNRESYC